MFTFFRTRGKEKTSEEEVLNNNLLTTSAKESKSQNSSTLKIEIDDCNGMTYLLRIVSCERLDQRILCLKAELEVSCLFAKL